MTRRINSVIRFPYDDDMDILYRMLIQRLDFGHITLKMTQSEYDEFAADTDNEEDFHASNFRPTNDQTDKCKLNWVFAGTLEFTIKIILK